MLVEGGRVGKRQLDLVMGTEEGKGRLGSAMGKINGE
jgi:hypothetical protein